MSNNICQFYVVIGDNSYVAPMDGNVYINATDKLDYKVIQDEIFRIYKEKAKLGIKVGSEIIFLVGGISDSEKAKDIINKLRLKGRIEVIKREERKPMMERPVMKESVKVAPSQVDNVPPMPPVRENFEVLPKEEKIVTEEVKMPESITNDMMEEIKQPDNVYRRDFESNNYNGYIGKPIEKKDKFGKLPLIIFIISLLLFIGSVVLLFVL